MVAFSRPIVLIMATLALPLAGACGGGGDDTQDPVALVVAFFAEPPADLPPGIEQGNDILIDASLSGEPAIAAAMLDYTSDALSFDVRVLFHRDEDAMRQTLTKNARQLDLELPEQGEIACWWDDEFAESDCIGARATAFVELVSYGEEEEGDVGQEEIERAQTQLFDAIDAHITRLIEDAPSAIAPLPKLPLAALLRSIPPAPAPDGAQFRESFEFGGTGLLEEFDGISPGWRSGETWQATYSVFGNSDDARSYRDRWLGNAATSDIDDPAGTCVRTRDTETDAIRWWVCMAVSENVLIFARHESGGTEPGVGAIELLRDLIERVELLQSGALPAPDEGEAALDRTGAVTAGATREATVAPTATATAEPGPAAVNAGEWTFYITVESNNCTGGDPPPGAVLQLQYRFTEAGSDGLLSNGEFFRVEQTLPGYRDFGVFQVALPVLTIELPVNAQELSGTGRLRIDFIDVDTANVHYTEDYGFCRIEADSRS